MKNALFERPRHDYFRKKVYNCIKKLLFLTIFSYLSYITAFYI